MVEVEGGTLTALTGFDGHQGVALIVAQRQFADLDQILARSIERNEPPLMLVLDSLEDPQNFGTLLRSAEAAGRLVAVEVGADGIEIGVRDLTGADRRA